MSDVVYMCFFFFRQKTTYEMRISDWSSDVCSSDLAGRSAARARSGEADIIWDLLAMPRKAAGILAMRRRKVARNWPRRGGDSAPRARGRSEERRVGKECVSTGSYRWSTYHSKNKPKKYKTLIHK